MKNCCYCRETFPDEVCRPYGLDGADACFECATKPENMVLTKKMTDEAIDRALILGKGSIIIGHHSGPMPLSVGEGDN